MDDTEDDARYPPNPCGASDGYVWSQREKLPVRNGASPGHTGDQYVEDDDKELEDDYSVESGVQRIGNDEYDNKGEEDEDDADDYGDQQQNQKKRKLKSLLLSYEFAPRVPAPAAALRRPSFGGRNPLADWSEHETFILLDAWGDRFLRQGRKSLRSEEWQEVAEKVSQQSEIERTDTQCRNRLDTLKKKYKKEKMKLAETTSAISNWVYFKKIDMLLSSNPQQGGLSGGMNSGELAFIDPRSDANQANGLDEPRDSVGVSESADTDEDGSEGLPPKRAKNGQAGVGGSSFKLLADSIHKFSEIYEKIESSKTQQMLELENMRMQFQRELEVKKRQIFERAQAEIAKIWQGDYEDNDLSAENVSG